MKQTKLTEKEVILIFQGINAIWWCDEDMKLVEKLEAKLRRQASDDPRLSAFIDKNWPTANK
jgi:hypothetical protein